MKIVLGFLIFSSLINRAYTQNVGIGTTSPTTDLEISKSPIVRLKLKSNSYEDTSQIIFSNKIGSSNSGTDFLLSFNKEMGLRFSSKSDLLAHNKSNILEIKPTGEIGLATSSPEAQFQINHLATTSNPSLTIFDSSSVNNGGGIIQFRNAAGVNKFSIKGSIGALSDGTDSYLDFNRNAVSRMTMRGDGMIGIGNQNPTERLDIEGNIALRGNNLFEFGKGVEGKEVNAGKIGYGVFGLPDVLSIVGGGQGPSLVRKIRLWAEAGTTFGGPAIVEGNLSVGTTVVPSGYKMSVDGKIIAEELRIQNSTAWPDYVFKSDYKLPTLTDVKSHIEKHLHLIGVPSAKDINEKGIVVGEMQNVLLRKIEELTLYVLDLQRQIDQLKVAKNEK